MTCCEFKYIIYLKFVIFNCATENRNASYLVVSALLKPWKFLITEANLVYCWKSYRIQIILLTFYSYFF